MSSPMDEFGLSFHQTRILFSLQYFLGTEDIDYEIDSQAKGIKRQWLTKWKESVEDLLKTQLQNNASQDTHSLFVDLFEIKREIESEKRSLTKKRPLYSILMEVALFRLYCPLGVKEDDKYIKVKLADTYRQRIVGRLESIAEWLSVEKEYVKHFKTSYEQRSNEISGSQSNPFNFLLGGLIGASVLAVVAAAIAVPVIVPLLAPLLAPGLFGAAAISAVLAALGGGAIAAGGLGMAGGFAVIVGGGAILGAGAGTGIGALFAQSPDSAVREVAKFVVSFEKVILTQRDVAKQEIAQSAKEITKQLINTIHSFEDRILEMQIAPEKNQNEINNLQKVNGYFRKALEICKNLLEEFLRRNGLS